MKFKAIIQARLSSTRFNEKVLKKINSLTIIEHIAIRLAQIKSADFSFCFAIANEKDKKLEKFMIDHNLPYMVGDELNVLERYLQASQELDQNDYIFRLTADNPFIDFTLLLSAIQLITNSNLKPDYAYYTGIPLGMGFEIVKVSALRRQVQFELKPNQKEHVTVFIREHPSMFSIEKFTYPLSTFSDHKEIPIRLTCDTEEDFKMLQKTAIYFVEKNNLFLVHDVLKLYLINTGFFKDNLHIEQKPDSSFEVKFQ